MNTYKEAAIFNRLITHWELSGFTIKDKELAYRRIINEYHALSLNNADPLYESLLPWLDKKNDRVQEILGWYTSHSYYLLTPYLFSFLAVCAVYKLSLPDCHKEEVMDVLLQAVSRALYLQEDETFRDVLFSECCTLLQENLPLKECIFRILLLIKKKSSYDFPGHPGVRGFGPAFLFELMSGLAGFPRESREEDQVAINTLLIYKSNGGHNERGTTASLLLKAFPGGFGELYPVPRGIRYCRVGETFLASLRHITTYMKRETGLWPEGCDISWELLPDNRELSLNNKILTGRSMEAAFVIGMLKLFAVTGAGNTHFPLRDKLLELNFKGVAVTAAVESRGRLGKVGGMWQKLCAAARAKLGFIVTSCDQSVSGTSRLVIIRAEDIQGAITQLHTEIGPEKIIEKIKKVLLKYATETKELENRCNDAFEGEDLTNIKGAVRFHDKPTIYVDDLIDICLNYKKIDNKHPLSILLEKILHNVPPGDQENVRELRILFETGFSLPLHSFSGKEKTGEEFPGPGFLVKRVSIKDIKKEQLKKKIHPMKKQGNPYVNRAMIHHPDLFFGRKKEVKRIIRRICSDSPQSISLLGERRIGKSSLMNYLTFLEGDGDVLDDPGKYLFVYLDCQGLRSINESRFLSIIFTELKNKLKDSIELNLKNDFDDLRFLCEEITAKGLTLVLLFDEFESITKNQHFPPAFYSLLRSLANNYTIALITSSIKNLKDMCRSREISDSPFFNIFTTQYLGLLREKEAIDLISLPSSWYGIPLAGLHRKIISESGLHPFFLQIMCCAWFDFLETSGLEAERFIKKPTPREVLSQFREETRQHFEFIYDTMQKNERLFIKQMIQGKAVKPDSYELELLERKGYVTGNDDTGFSLFSSEFKRFIQQYSNRDT